MDDQERPLAVAALDAGIAGESRWRDAFAATTNAIARSETAGRLYVGADFSAVTPWVAYPEERLEAAERTFVALGMTYEPTPAGSGEQPAPAVPAVGRTPAAEDLLPPPPSIPAPPPPGPPKHPDPPASVPSRPGAGRWALPATGLVLGLVAGGGLVALLGPDPAAPEPAGTAGPPSLPAPAPTATPLSPGLEPPKEDGWPAQWPRFAATDRIRTVTDLDGLAFPVKVPVAWQCAPVERAEGLSRHRCGTPVGSGAEIGGELVVRECAAPCDGPRQTAMRAGEEAWGLQWIRSGPASTYAETSSLTGDGERRYGLVVVAYWRGGDGDIDRQLVLRMTAPVAGANQLRRVANYLRDVLVF
ncbi:hypothetical protein [Micromonospora carbonacea]|uniref:hypothetical protein n=1 Tax=Micromonospora carbonacea TaxID=47853 RepID=UPI003D750EE7